MPDEFEYDVFISYSHRDDEWVWNWLLPRLKAAGLVVCVDRESFDIGVPSLVNMERAVARSRKTLLVLTPSWVESEWTNFESLLVQTDDPIGLRRRMLPLLLEPCEPPRRISIFQYADFTRSEERDHQLGRIIDAIHDKISLPPVLAAPSRSGIPRPPKPYFAHPHPLQANFTGRVAERQMLTEWLAPRNKAVLVLVAIGGMGKSALAWYWIVEDVLKSRIKLDGILWWSFYEGESSFPRFLDEALSYVSGGTIDPSDIQFIYDKGRALVSLLQEKRVLIVLDGLERQMRAYAAFDAVYQADEAMDGGGTDMRTCVDIEASRVLQWLASGILVGKVLITSRLFPHELEGPGGQPLVGCRKVELLPMASDDAVEFCLSQGVTKGTPAEIRSVCEHYGHHPLALRLLSGVVAWDKRQPGDIAVASRYSVIGDLKARQHHVLEAAYDTLTPDLRVLISRLAAFRSPMDYEAIAILNPFGNEVAFHQALNELIARGLLLFDRDRVRYDLHPVVRSYAYDRLTDKQGVHTRLRGYFIDLPVPTESDVRSIDDLMPVIELYHHTVRAGRYDEALRLYRDRLNKYVYYEFGAYETEIELLTSLLVSEEGKWNLYDDRDVSWVLNSLAGSYGKIGQVHRAVSLLEIAKSIDEKRDSLRSLGITLGNLAEKQTDLGKLRAAEANLEQEIELACRTKSEFHEGMARYDLANLLIYLGKFDLAECELNKASELLARVRRRKERQSSVEASRSLLALFRGDVDEALKVAKRALESAYTSRYERHIIAAQLRIGEAYNLLRRPDKARPYLNDALSRCRKTNQVELEPDILLEWARWHHLEGSKGQAKEEATEALRFANRCGYRLKQAEIRNFLAQLALETEDVGEARRHAEIAKEHAWCDGPPYCYKLALAEAERLLQVIDRKAV